MSAAFVRELGGEEFARQAPQPGKANPSGESNSSYNSSSSSSSSCSSSSRVNPQPRGEEGVVVVGVGLPFARQAP